MGCHFLHTGRYKQILSLSANFIRCTKEAIQGERCQDGFGSWRYVWPCMKYGYITYPLGAMYPQFKTADLNIKWQWLWNTMVYPSEFVTLLYRTIHRYIVVTVVVTNSKPAEISTRSNCCYKNNYWIRIITSVKQTSLFLFLSVTSFSHTSPTPQPPLNMPTARGTTSIINIKHQRTIVSKAGPSGRAV